MPCRNFSKVISVLLVILSLPAGVVYLLTLQARYRMVRIGLIVGPAIGHLILDSQFILYSTPPNERNGIRLVYVGKPANFEISKQIDKSIKKVPLCIASAVVALTSRINFFRKLRYAPDFNSISWQILDSAPAFLRARSFASKEEAKFLEYGIDINQPFATLCVRDSAFQEERYPDKSFKEIEWRDGKLDDYIGAIEYLTKSGLQVIRMGRLTHNHKISIRGFFDYSASEIRSDEMDLMIFSKTKFNISNSSGIDEIPRAFRKTNLLVNFLPIKTGSLSVLYPPVLPLVLKSDEDLLPLRYILKKQLFDLRFSSELEANSVAILPNRDSTLIHFLSDYLDGKTYGIELFKGSLQISTHWPNFRQ